MRTLSLALVAVAAAAPLSALAYTHGKPGLWTVTTDMKFTKGGPQIPPEALAMMKQRGMKIPGQEPLTSDICITPEQAAQDEPPKPQQRGACDMQNLKRDGKTFTGDLVCHGEMEGSGHMKVTYDSDEHYAGGMQFSGTSKQGGPMEWENNFSGQWKSTDCGAVKPYAQK